MTTNIVSWSDANFKNENNKFSNYKKMKRDENFLRI